MSFVFPADWEPHEAVWLAWPPEDWVVNGESVRDAHCRVVCALLPRVRVVLLVNSAAEERDVRERVCRAALGSEACARLCCRVVPHTDIWMRDFGPVFVRDSSGSEAVLVLPVLVLLAS